MWTKYVKVFINIFTKLNVTKKLYGNMLNDNRVYMNKYFKQLIFKPI